MKKIAKKLECVRNGHNMQPLTNFYGDSINRVSKGKQIYRSAYKCTKCGKIEFRSELIQGKDIPVNLI